MQILLLFELPEKQIALPSCDKTSLLAQADVFNPLQVQLKTAFLF